MAVVQMRVWVAIARMPKIQCLFVRTLAVSGGNTVPALWCVIRFGWNHCIYKRLLLQTDCRTMYPQRCLLYAEKILRNPLQFGVNA